MSKETAIVYYITTMMIFKKLFITGIITKEELTTIDTVIANKYGLSPRSIYRHNA